MRFIVFSDIHVHPWTFGASLDEDGINTRLQDGIDVLRQVLEACARTSTPQADAVLFAGDLFQEMGRVSTAAFNRVFATLFLPTGIDIRMIAGNHDLIVKHQWESAIRSLHYIHSVRVAEEPTTWIFAKDPTLAITAVPYLEDPTELAEAVANAWLREEKRPHLEVIDKHVLLMHNGIAEEAIARGYSTTDAATLAEIHEAAPVEEGWNLVLAGHYHAHARYALPNGAPAVHVGATMQHNFGDCGQVRGWLDVTIHDDGSVDVKLVESNAPKFWTLRPGDETSQVRECDFVRWIGTPTSDVDAAAVTVIESQSGPEKDRGGFRLTDDDSALLRRYVEAKQADESLLALGLELLSCES